MRRECSGLPGQRIDAFVSPAANGTPPDDKRYQPVTADLVKVLAERSQSRVAQSTEFAEMAKKRDEAKKNQGVIHLDQIEKEKKEDDAADNAETSASSRAAAREKSPQIQEAVTILADLVSLEQNPAAAQGKAQHQAQNHPATN